MTRLQELLSQIKTVKDLADILNISEDDVIAEIAVSTDGKPMNCIRCNCACCEFNTFTGCNMNQTDMITYLNSEVPQVTKSSTDSVKTNCSTEIIAMREKARKALLTFMKKKFLSGASGQETGLILTHHVSLLEQIGLFEKDELRNELVKYLEKLL